MIWIAVQVLGSAFMAAIGAAVVARHRRTGTAIMAFMILLIVLKSVICHIPAVEPRLFPWDWYPRVEHWWFLFPTMFVFGTGFRIVRDSVWKRDIVLSVAGFLQIYCGLFVILGSLPHELKGAANDEGICLQTSGYSCAAASSVTLLYQYGIIATEQEMAELCFTRCGETTVSGTSDAGIVRGLRLKLGSRGVAEVIAPTLDAIPLPSLVPIRITSRAGHCIMVTGIDREDVFIIDPLYGRGRMHRTQFERTWQGSAIHVRTNTTK